MAAGCALAAGVYDDCIPCARQVLDVPLHGLGGGLLEVAEHGRLVVGLDLQSRHVQRVLRAITEARAEAVAIALLDQPRLAVDHLQRALDARRHAVAAAVALLFIDRDDLTFNLCHDSQPFYCGFLYLLTISAPKHDSA